MTQNRFGSAGEDGGQASAVKRETSVADGVDARVEPMQATGLDGAIDGAAGIAERAGQLTDRYDAMLPLCEFREPSR